MVDRLFDLVTLASTTLSCCPLFPPVSHILTQAMLWPLICFSISCISSLFFLVDFWRICGLNRDMGIQQLSKHEVVKFKDVTVMKKDSDEIMKTVGTLIKELSELIKQISDENSLKSYITDHFKIDIRSNKKLSTVSNFYENVKEIIKSQNIDTNLEEGGPTNLSASDIPDQQDAQAALGILDDEEMNE
jgi:hypothetical protein